MVSHDKNFRRVQVEAGGYTWRVHCCKLKQRWQCHLVELVGPLPLTRPMTQVLRDKIRTELAKSLKLDEATIVRITADLILD